MSERIQKILARAGHGSRRQIEAWIQEGKITVNGETAKLGISISEEDNVQLNGRDIEFHISSTCRVMAYHKPEGELCTRSDPEGRTTVFDKIPPPETGRWILVGRLDINTSGLLLLTTDGELANRLMHPSSQIEREYAVRVLGEVDLLVLKQLKSGVMLEDGMASFSRIVDVGGRGANRWYNVILKEGKNHEVRRLWASQGLTVSRLKRIRFGPIVLSGGLRVGRWRELEIPEIQPLLKQAGLPEMEEPKLDLNHNRDQSRQNKRAKPTKNTKYKTRENTREKSKYTNSASSVGEDKNNRSQKSKYKKSSSRNRFSG